MLSEGVENFIEDPNFIFPELNVSQIQHSYLEDFLFSMSLIRAAEIKIAKAKKNGLIKGPVHLGVGQEAIAVGVSKSLRDTDRTGAHRSHSHILGVDKDLRKLFAEVLGRKTGFCWYGRFDASREQIKRLHGISTNSYRNSPFSCRCRIGIKI